MTTRIQSGGPDTSIAATETASRVTPPPARPFRSVMNASAEFVVSSAEAAVTRLPGGPVLAAAFRSNPGQSSMDVPAAATAEGSAGTAESAGPAAGGAGSADAMLARNGDQNLYFLRLQEQISAESRAYTAMSNVLKARHDTIKNAIGNIR